jgi:hypothetical protein
MLLGTGYTSVDSAVSCVITRFAVRSPWSLLRFYLMYRAVRREAKTIPGVLTTAFLIEGPHTCYTLSLFKDAEAIGEFNSTVRAHIAAANGSFRHLQLASGRPHLWSAQFQLAGVSPFNLRWGASGVDASMAEARGVPNEHR